MKKIFLLLSLLGAVISYGQPATQWFRQASFLGDEDIPAMAYVPGDASDSPSVWTFILGSQSLGGPGGPLVSEGRLAVHDAATGNTLFDYLVTGARIEKISYDASIDQVLVLMNVISEFAMIGADTITPAAIPPGCLTYFLASYNRSGQLQAKHELPIPCTHFVRHGLSDIDPLRHRVALGVNVIGSADSTMFTFGSMGRILRKDTSYISVLEWDYSGAPQMLAMFPDPANSSGVYSMTYGANGDIYLMGSLYGDLRFGSFNLSRSANEKAAFITRLRADGTVGIAKKVFSSPHTASTSSGLTYNPVNKHLYFAAGWSKELIVNGTLIQALTMGYGNNLLIEEIDSNLVHQHFTTLRYADTASSAFLKLNCWNSLYTDRAGNIVFGGWMADSLMVGQKLFRSSSPPSDGWGYNAMVIRFDKNLVADTAFLSQGLGDERVTLLAFGPGNEIYVGGSFDGPAKFDAFNAIVQSPSQDAYVVKLSLMASTATAIPGIPIAGICSVYPNPASDRLFINLEGIQQISIYASDGRLVYQQKCNSKYTTQIMDISRLASGLYHVQAGLARGASRSARFVKR